MVRMAVANAVAAKVVVMLAKGVLEGGIWSWDFDAVAVGGGGSGGFGEVVVAVVEEERIADGEKMVAIDGIDFWVWIGGYGYI